MRTVKSTDALQLLALRKGASASVGGSQFNSTGDKVDAVRQTKPEPTPEPKPEPVTEPTKAEQLPDLAPIVQSAVDAMAASVSEVAKDNARVMGEVLKAVERITAVTPSAPAGTQTISPAAPDKNWRLVINRNLRGVMETVDITRVG